MRPLTASPARTALPTAHFERNDGTLASAIAYLVLAASLFASLLEFFASLPALP
jgi:hypothetical protein